MTTTRSTIGACLWGSLAYCMILMGVTISCTPDLQDDPIPPTTFSPIYINLNLPSYNALRTDKGSMIIDGGERGIILYRENANTYYAYERNCSYQPNSACATVDIHISTLYMEDPCCGSTFSLSTGTPTGGPAWRPLRKYETLLTGSELTITDLIVE